MQSKDTSNIVHKTQNEDKQIKEQKSENRKDDQHGPHQSAQVFEKGKQFLFLIRHPHGVTHIVKPCKGRWEEEFEDTKGVIRICI